MENQAQILAPINASQRILSLDVLRGFAVLGILIMNMISFAMVGTNYINPMAEGMLIGGSKYAFFFSQLFANQKFMSLFSILFGAGIVLMASRSEASGKKSAGKHYLRNAWLLIFGLLHAYGLWYGDILVPYAICSIWVFLFRNRSPRTLFIWAGGFFMVTLLISLFFGTTMSFWPKEEVLETCKSWVPPIEEINKEVAAYRGSWLDQMSVRVETALMMETFIFFIGLGWQITALMLTGMALFKTKILTGERSPALYRRLAIIGCGLGLTIGVIGLWQNYAHNWSCEYSFFLGSQFNYLSSLPMALGYIGIIMLLLKSKLAGILIQWLAPVGQMALTNYLVQTIFATLIFYGHGFGLFGTVNRLEQWIFIIGIWIFQVIFSRWWLAKYKFGPFEWLWRSLTYRKMQPFK